MIRLLVLYGHPKDPEAFDRYYAEIHVPLAQRMRGLKKWTIGKVTGTPGDAPSPYYYIADLYADTREQLDAIIASPEGQAAVADVPNYATGGVTFLYTEVEDVPVR
ncbi:MAG TPA: EthD family reductase [Pirellulaceae bacterium]|nr:EthD family reductase [Pirellulaceae bacterium]